MEAVNDEMEIVEHNWLDKCKTPGQLDDGIGHDENISTTKRPRNDSKSKATEALDRQLLGSLTTYNCQRTRTSARVIQKMKQDQQITVTTSLPTAASNERTNDGQRKDERQLRTNKASWSNLERNHFFDALNEFGKDFEPISNYINSKLKRRTSALDDAFKTKDQVRQHYYQTYHKLCKYIRFSEEVRKPVQELYALINYGEMRRKLQFVTEKHFMKFRNLVYNGYITVRSKGKNIRIKTPSCKALRRLNQLDDSLEDIKLPSKIEVLISPASIEAFGRVQSLAQNPRCRTTVPLHKKLINFMKAFQCKWRSHEALLIDEAKLSANNEQQIAAMTTDINYVEPEICFLPKPGVTIHRPLLSITECLSSVNICLTAYEERMGVTVKGESLNTERPSNLCSTIPAQCYAPSSKRLCLENPSENIKRPVELSLMAAEETLADTEAISHRNAESSSDELADEIHAQIPLNDIPPLNANSSKKSLGSLNGAQQQQSSAARSKRLVTTKPFKPLFKPLVNEDVIQRIRSGWTISTAADITIGDLYVILGHDSKLELNYYWLPESNTDLQSSGFPSSPIKVNNPSASADNFIKNEDNNTTIHSISKCSLSNKLKHLLLVANLSDRLRKRPCNCERTTQAKYKLERDLTNRTFLSNKTIEQCVGGCDYEDKSNHNFRQPKIPNRRLPLVDPVKQLTALNRQKLSRQVLVQRFLLPNNGNVNNAEHQTQFKQEPKSTPKEESNSLQDNKLVTAGESLTTSKTNDTDEMTKLPSFQEEDGLFSSEKTVTEQQHDEDHEMDNNNDMLGKLNAVSSTSSNFDESSNISFLNGLCPMQLLRDSTSNSRWLEDNINDFSLTSLLGHLEDGNNPIRDILDAPSNISIISESSVDYMHKFQEIKALLPFHDRD